MVIYRVEDERGYGPYYQTKSTEWEIAIAAHRSGNVQHPSALEDGIDRWDHYAELFAFTSLDQLRAWFNGAERLYLGTYHQFKVSCYVAYSVRIGHKQCTYNINQATLIWQKPLNHI